MLLSMTSAMAAAGEYPKPRSASIIALASTAMGLAMTAGAGVPVIVPDRGGAADHADNGAGLTYRAANALSLAAAIERQIVDPMVPGPQQVNTMQDHFADLFAEYEGLRQARGVAA